VISILLVDDQDLVREGLRVLADAEPDLSVARPPTVASPRHRHASSIPTTA
jgi:DNA-binding NarL/FixJ family response regulator